MKYLKINRKSMEAAKAKIKAGGVVIFPTETVYGIGASINSKKGIKRIYKIKKRPKSKPLQVLISNYSQLNELVSEIPESAEKLMKKHWPGPMTLVFKKKGGGTIGIRMPNHKVPLEIINDCGPIAASSANVSGENPPVSAQEMKIKADLLLDGGRCKIKKASKVVDITSGRAVVIRE